MQVWELIRFCKKHKVDIIHSHLQQTNLIATIASKFMAKTRVVPFRHHCKFHHLIDDPSLRPSKKEIWADQIINRLSKIIIVPASSVKAAMVEQEQVTPNKVKVIPYIYHFKEMERILNLNAEAIKIQYPAVLRMIMVSRLTPYKRHLIALNAIIPLIQGGHDIQLLIMDTGPEMGKLKKEVKKEGVSDKIHFLGFQSNILEYIAAADVLIHPSLTDASNSAVKEAGLFEKLVMVCDRVGDFNDYIVHGENGYLFSAQEFVSECQTVLKKVMVEKNRISEMGSKLKKAVTAKFSYNESVVDQYERL